MSRPGRADRYEAQLTDGELMALHTSLMGGRQKLEQIRDAAPAWRDGPMRGRKPSISTLGNIRERLVMEETLRENEQTTEAILAQVAAEDPQIPAAKLDEIGQRLFKTLSIRQLNLDGWVALQKAEKSAGDLKLARERFEIETAKQLLDEAKRRRADAVANDPALDEAARIAEMRKVYFGDVDALAATGEIQLPPP